MQLLRLLRLLRLFRLVRMIRLARIFRRWESHIDISYSHLKLIRFSVAVLVCAHWLACGFYLVVVLEDSQVGHHNLFVHAPRHPGTRSVHAQHTDAVKAMFDACLSSEDSLGLPLALQDLFLDMRWCAWSQ